MSERSSRSSEGPPESLAPVSGPSSIDLDGPESDGRNRRSSERLEVVWAVDCTTEETFLYASITNISAMGIFVRTTDPHPVGTRVRLRFTPPKTATLVEDADDSVRVSIHEPEAFALEGVVQWVNAVRPLSENLNPGMGISFLGLTLDDRERIVDAIHTIAYLREEPAN